MDRRDVCALSSPLSSGRASCRRFKVGAITEGTKCGQYAVRGCAEFGPCVAPIHLALKISRSVRPRLQQLRRHTAARNVWHFVCHCNQRESPVRYPRG
jgi:hypothetical protein